MNEDLLDARGPSPLLRAVKTVRDLFQGKTTIVDVFEDDYVLVPNNDDDDSEKRRKGLTAAIAYLHSRGTRSIQCIGAVAHV